MKEIYALVICAFIFHTCAQSMKQHHEPLAESSAVDLKIVTGAEQMDLLIPMLKKKRVIIVANQTSVVGKTHLVDTLLAQGVQIVRVFAPEHGFRGDHGAGETVKSTKDVRTSLPVSSLYGSTKKPTAAMLADADCILFDIQDVGARFYTYISTMHYVMEAAAESNKEVIILDRPNPNGFYVDGPVLDTNFRSFVGMHPIPVVHGLTVGELAQMINGEKWLKAGLTCNLKVITCKNYTHDSLYVLPIPPSPNLPNQTSIYLYPSICFFEGTRMSVGRGTDRPFQVIGYPGMPSGSIEFTPQPIPGIAPNPEQKGKVCRGHDLREFGSAYFTVAKGMYIDWLVEANREYPFENGFISSSDFFDKLAGSHKLRKQLEQDLPAGEIKKSWSTELEVYMSMRSKYLLYPDFQHR
ncbi:MAG: DUF1343 domain-containing protein [Flavobacteriales bacterium]|nr:DUF1343 domain-containing protein [Flavobacteriales bacterium]